MFPPANSFLFQFGDHRFNIAIYILLTVHMGTILVNNQIDALFYVFISLLYMFRATQCSSSGESIVSIHHLVYITLYRWPSGM